MATTQQQLAALIVAHLDELTRPGVLSARPGFHLVDGWLTATPAIVVTATGPVSLPKSIDGVPVDVRQASPAKRQRLEDPATYARTWGPAPDAGAVPEFATELDLSPATTGLAVPELAGFAPGFTPETKAPKPNLPYTPPAGASLAPVRGTVTVSLSASPDSGWGTLKPFLAATRDTLTVGLYDFTSAHILAAVEGSLAGKTLRLVLDHPAKNPTADQTDEQTVAALEKSLGAGLTQAWALDRMDPLAAAWIFPTAYHIKVAVRDGSAVWLSSGNWNNSNQPDIDPVTRPADATEARTRDRDWHVVIEHPALATTFEAFLLNDLEIAKAHTRAAPAAEFPAALLPNAQTPPFQTFFPARTITEEMTITPLLTPDAGVYAPAVKALIGGAKRSLHLQFQYIELPKKPGQDSAAFADLVQAIVERQNAGVEVKIIMSQYETAGYLEQLQAAGLDVVDNVRIQNNVHNKGIVVDGARVLVSSQNWSTAGTLHNRDAGVIIENQSVADYFQQLFLHDWNTLAQKKVASD